MYAAVLEAPPPITLADTGSAAFSSEAGGSWFGSDLSSFSVTSLTTSFAVASETVELDVISTQSSSVLGVMALSTVETCSESAFEVDGVKEASVPAADDAGNALVGSGLSLLRERLLGCLGLSEVGLMLAGGGGGT